MERNQNVRQYQQLCLCQEGVVFPLSPTNNNHHHCHPNLTTPLRHSIPTLEGKCVYQILHVLHSFIKLNVNQSLVCLSKWLSLPRTKMTAWCWTKIRRATKIIITSREAVVPMIKKLVTSVLRHTQILHIGILASVINTQYEIHYGNRYSHASKREFLLKII